MSSENPEKIKSPEEVFEEEELEKLKEWSGSFEYGEFDKKDIKEKAESDVGVIVSYPEKAILVFEELKKKGNKEDFNKLIDDLQKLTEKYIRLRDSGGNPGIVMGQMKFVALQIRSLKDKDNEQEIEVIDPEITRTKEDPGVLEDLPLVTDSNEVKTEKGIYEEEIPSFDDLWEKIKDSQEIEKLESSIKEANSLEDLTDIFADFSIEVEGTKDKKYKAEDIRNILKELIMSLTNGLHNKDLLKSFFIYKITRNLGLRDKVFELVSKHIEDTREKEQQEEVPSEGLESISEVKSEAVESPKNDLEKSSLEDLRRAYHTMRHKRGLVLRRGTVEVEGQQFSANNFFDLIDLRDLYNNKLSIERKARILEFTEEVGADQDRLLQKMIDFQKEEQEEIDKLLEEMGDKNSWQKFRKVWKSKTGMISRMAGGFGLVGVALTGGALGIVAGTTRGALSGMGTYFAAEAMLERWGKWSRKGLFNEVAKATRGMDDPQLIKHINELNPEDVKNEIARLKALQIEKMVSLEKAGIISGRHTEHDRKVLEFLIKRNYEVFAESATKILDESRVVDVSEAISEYLYKENTYRLLDSEIQTDEERKNKIKRKIVAGILGGTAGAVIGSRAVEIFGPKESATAGVTGEVSEAPAEAVSKGFTATEQFSTDSVTNKSLDQVSIPEGFEPPSFVETVESKPLDMIIEVSKGENLWKIIERKLEEQGLFENFATEGERTHLIDAMKDRFAEMNPDELKQIGISSGDINRLAVGDKIDLSGVLGNDELVEKWVEKTGSLSESAIKSIEANNKTIAEWAERHPDVRLDAKTIDNILKVGRNYEVATGLEGSEAVADISPEKIELKRILEIIEKARSTEANILESSIGIKSTEWQGIRELPADEFMSQHLDINDESLHPTISLQDKLHKLKEMSGTYPKSAFGLQEAETVGEYLSRASKSLAESQIETGIDTSLDPFATNSAITNLSEETFEAESSVPEAFPDNPLEESLTSSLQNTEEKITVPVEAEITPDSLKFDNWEAVFTTDSKGSLNLSFEENLSFAERAQAIENAERAILKPGYKEIIERDKGELVRKFGGSEGLLDPVKQAQVMNDSINAAQEAALELSRLQVLLSNLEEYSDRWYLVKNRIKQITVPSSFLGGNEIVYRGKLLNSSIFK